MQQSGVQLVTDTVSYELLKGATVDYTTDLIRASFEVGLTVHAIPCCFVWHSNAPSLINFLVMPTTVTESCIVCRSLKIQMPLGNVAVVHLLSQRCDLNFCVQICFCAMLHTVVVRVMSVTKLRC